MKWTSLICSGIFSAALACAQPLAPVPKQPDGKPVAPVPKQPDGQPVAPVPKQPPSTPLAPGKPLPPGGAEGSNVGRNADTQKPPKPKPKPRPSRTPDECRSSAAAIQKEYYDEATTDEKKADLRQESRDLARQCARFGGFDGGPLPPSSKGGTPKRGGSSGYGGGGGGGGSAGTKTATPPPPKPRPIGGINAVAILAGGPSGASGRTIPKGLPTMLVRDKTAQQHLTTAWQGLSAQPGVQPRQDTNVEAQVTTPSVPEVADASEMARNGLASVAQIEREAAALNAYAQTLARYLGAQQKGDQAGMARQVQPMPKLIDTASDAAYAAARSRAAANKLILAELEGRQASAKQAGGWSQALPNLGGMSTADLPPEVRNELKSSGMEAQGIPQLLSDLNSPKTRNIDSGIASLRAQVKADSASANGPQPPDLANLEREKLKAQQLAASAGAATPSK